MFQKPYAKRRRSTLKFRDEEGNHDGLTEQHHKSLCDINNIIHNYDKTGLINHVSSSTAQYGDFTGINEYQQALHVIMHADEAFSGLPSDVRKRFENDPGKFFEFATNPDNHDELVEMGLATPEFTPEPQKVEVVNQAKTAESEAE